MRIRETELASLYLIFDLIILNLAMAILAIPTLNISLENHHEMSIYVLHGNLSWIITYFIFSKKNLYLRDGFINRINRITKRTLVFLAVSAVAYFLLLPKYYSRVYIVEYSALFYIGKLTFYFLLYSYLKNNRKKGIHVNRVVIAGINNTSHLLRNIITSNYLMGYQFIGFLNSEPSDDLDVIGHPDDLESIIDEHQIQMVFVTLSHSPEENRRREFLKICNQKGIRLRYIPENQRWYKTRQNMESVGSLVLINPQEIPLDDFGSRIGKRIFDFVFSLAVILLIFSWLFPILAILIKASSKGPVFFVQKRTGYNNNAFNCLKFRSMQVNANANTQQATANDNRITWIGRFIRKTNIDEFPQFFNVLWGQMSVVGPRPHMLKHTEEYSGLIEYYLTRHYIKPGITGWAQVNGYRGETDEVWKMQKRVDFDKEYIENWTFGWDIKILFMTVFEKKSYNNAQ